MGEIPIIFLVFVLIWVAVVVCCRTFSSEDHYLSERAQRRDVILSQQQALRQCQIPRRGQQHQSSDIRVTPIRVTTISRSGGSVAMDFYQIQIPPRRLNNAAVPGQQQRSGSNNRPSRFVVEAPPPPFNTAYLVSSPVFHPDDLPPPTYEESLKNKEPEVLRESKDVTIHM